MMEEAGVPWLVAPAGDVATSRDQKCPIDGCRRPLTEASDRRGGGGAKGNGDWLVGLDLDDGC